jgi:HIRAN domain-containing protein
MGISVEIKRYEQTFRTTIAGVTKQNTDGTDRQALIKALRRGEAVRLVREPNNPYDKYAIAVFRISGEQLGYIPAGDRRLADHIDMGGHVSARVVRIVGGSGLLGLFFKAFRKHYGCVIEISKGGFISEVLPYTAESRKIEDLIKAAQALEAKDSAKAISTYREAIAQIIVFGKAGSVKAAWRRARYPVNRLSLLLEKRGELQSAQEVILQYEQFNDAFGLTAAEKKSIDARKQRLARKLNA